MTGEEKLQSSTARNGSDLERRQSILNLFAKLYCSGRDAASDRNPQFQPFSPGATAHTSDCRTFR